MKEITRENKIKVTLTIPAVLLRERNHQREVQQRTHSHTIHTGTLGKHQEYM